MATGGPPPPGCNPNRQADPPAGETGRRPADPLAGLRLAMGRVCREHGLDRRELMAYQRAVHALDRAGEAPTPDEFWAATAQPRARHLLDAARATIDRELPAVARTGDVLAVGDVVAALPSTAAIDELGRWWQRRLRRAAAMRALPDVAARLPGAAELTIAHHEMWLLDQAPWSHGDRLLSAFELAYAEIRRHGREQALRLWPVQAAWPTVVPDLQPA